MQIHLHDVRLLCLDGDAVGGQLELVVQICAGRVVARVDHGLDGGLDGLVGQLQHQPARQVRDGVRVIPEGGVRGVVGHDLHERLDLLGVLAGHQQRLRALPCVLREVRALVPAHHLGHLCGELPGRLLHAECLAGSEAEHEAEVDVDDVAHVVDHHVAVVAVLDAQRVRHDAVAGHGRHVVVDRRAEGGGLGLALHEAIGGLEVLAQRALVALLLLQAVQGHGVGDQLDEARGLRGAEDRVAQQPHGQVRLAEGVLVVPDELHDEYLLAHVVVTLRDEAAKLPPGQVAVGGLGPQAMRLLLEGLTDQRGHRVDVFVPGDRVGVVHHRTGAAVVAHVDGGGDVGLELGVVAGAGDGGALRVLDAHRLQAGQARALGLPHLHLRGLLAQHGVLAGLVGVLLAAHVLC
eukprot:Colp12_sorted_trinity150504_noHs@11282